MVFFYDFTDPLFLYNGVPVDDFVFFATNVLLNDFAFFLLSDPSESLIAVVLRRLGVLFGDKTLNDISLCRDSFYPNLNKA